ncbi:hypothetical protein [Candidatus Magnetominusculus dajiuhuensis]|uniref:hypothetical protein n=1 Tax=Candidatus Magnetominusculus dajiuhuensis TaxID=3137712 RepID=UPI003B42E1A4
MKIVYFDYWTKGIHHFLNFDKILKEKGHSTLLFHLGSFIGTCAKEEVLDGILCRDISFYNTKYIHKALQSIKPDVVLVLNNKTLMDRAVTLACRALGIKSVFLMHGMVIVGDDEIADYLETIEKAYNSNVNKIKKIPKYFRFVLPNYIYSSFKYDNKNIKNLHFLNVIWANAKNPGLSLLLPHIATEELATDKSLVYAEIYREYYLAIGFKESQIVVVGNPHNENLFRQIKSNDFKIVDLPQEVVTLIENNRKYALYLEDSFVENSNMGGWTDEYRNDHLKQIADRLKNEDVTLVVKLHPGTNISNIKVNSDNIIIISKATLSTLSYYADFCIGHISTTVHISIILKKPVLIPRWDRSKNIIDYYCKHKVANAWNHVDDDIDLSVNQKAREEFIRIYITITEPTAIGNIVENILK